MESELRPKKEKKSKKQVTQAIFTINNYTDATIASLDNWYKNGKLQYLVFGKEVGESGTHHLQGFVQFKKKSLYGTWAKILHGHFEEAKGTFIENVEYAKKDRDFVEYGEGVDRQQKCRDQGEVEKQRWANAKQCAIEGRFDEIDPQIYICNYANLHSIHADHMPKLPSLDNLDNYWIWGPTGVGKSFSVRQANPDLYPKPRNKW